MHITGQGLALGLGGSFRLCAEGHQRISRRLLAQGHLVHAAQRLVGGVQHGGRGHRRTGQRIKGATVHRIQADKLRLEGFFLGPRAEARGLSKVGIADGAAGHQTVSTHAQVHRHGGVVAVLAGGHAVAHHVAVRILGGIERRHVRVAGGDGQLLIAVRRHDRIERFAQSRIGAFLDRALGDHVGQGQGHRRDQRDDPQDDERRQLLLRLRRSLLVISRIVFHCTGPSITGRCPYA